MQVEVLSRTLSHIFHGKEVCGSRETDLKKWKKIWINFGVPILRVKDLLISIFFLKFVIHV